MKTFAAISIAAVLLMAAALPVVAGTNDTILIGLSASYNGVSQGSTIYGTQPGALDGVDSTDRKWDPPINGAPEIDSQLVLFSFPRDDNRWQIDQRAPLVGNQHKYWDLHLYVNGGGDHSILTLNAWVLPTGMITSSDYTARLWLGSYYQVRSGGGTLLWTAPLNTSGSASSPQFTRPLLPSMPPMPSQSLTLELAQVPEPGALATLLSGLAGLAGFALRRRR